MPIDRSGTQEGNYSKLPLLFLPSNNSRAVLHPLRQRRFAAGQRQRLGRVPCNDEFVETQFVAPPTSAVPLIHRDIRCLNPIVPNQVKGYFSSKYVDPDFIGERTSARPYLIRFSDIALVYAEAAGPEEGLAYVNRIRERAGDAASVRMMTDEFRKAVIERARIGIRGQPALRPFAARLGYDHRHQGCRTERGRSRLLSDPAA